ncbi:MAG: hypothetical protein RL660_129 [Bacteroidota bacterium]|jgi:putative endopeptidase
MYIAGMKNLAFICGAAALLCSTGCAERSGSNIGNKPDLLASHSDTTIKPGDDFFAYANGYWLSKNPIPASESGWGIFSLVDEENKNRILKISQDASANSGPAGSSSQLIGDFFSSGMDSAGIEKMGASAIQPQLDIINNIKTQADLQAAMVALTQYGLNTGFNIYVDQDLKNSDKTIVYLSQGGLGMGERAYYFDNDSTTKKIRSAYPGFVATLLQNAGASADSAAAEAKNILAMETGIAQVHRPIEKLRDTEKNYNKMDLASLQKLAPGMDWKAYFSALKLNVDSVVVGQPECIAAFAKSLNATNINTWKSYLRYHTLAQMAPYLSKAYVDADFAFNGALQGGLKKMRDRWKRVLGAQENALGDALGQLYVKEYFSKAAKERYLKVTDVVIQAYREHIQNLPWMGDSTKQKALTKLNSITKKVGYPDKWRDYKGMTIVRNNYAQNVMQANKWQVAYNFAKLGKPVDRTEWGMTPQTYNAYYNPSNNEIVLPAAIFTAPGYADEELDDALVYGYVGASTIGHELTHGFDDQGRKFDNKGNLVDWWTKEDADKFTQQADKLVAQFNAYKMLGDKHPNGELTLGENIADLGGVVIAFDAFKKTKQYASGKPLAGLTPSQRYFMGYAYGWMQSIRPEKLAQQLMTDEHAPYVCRVNVPMSNCDEWYKAFNVKPGDKFWRDSADRVRIW